MKEYEEKAVSLALNNAKLQDVTNRLKAARLTCPLFDTKRWVSTTQLFFCILSIIILYENGCLHLLSCNLKTWGFISGEKFGAFLLQDVESVLLRPAPAALQSIRERLGISV